MDGNCATQNGRRSTGDYFYLTSRHKFAKHELSSPDLRAPPPWQIAKRLDRETTCCNAIVLVAILYNSQHSKLYPYNGSDIVPVNEKRSYGRVIWAPSDVRGGNRQTEPTATAPHSYSTEPGPGRVRKVIHGNKETGEGFFFPSQKYNALNRSICLILSISTLS